MRKVFFNFLYVLLFTLVFFLKEFFRYKKLKVSILDPKFGQTLRFIEGFLIAKEYYDFKELKENKILFLLTIKNVIRK